MKFLYPEFLWALTALLIPVIIHLFNFKRHKTLYFSSLKFIKHIDEETKSTQKLKHLLILTTRLLAFISIVLAFAQPFFNDSKVTKSDDTVHIYIDNSFSMQAHGVEGELISQARERIKELVNAASPSTQFIISTNSLSGRESQPMNKMSALEKIENIELSPLKRTLTDVVKWQSEIAAKNKSTKELSTQFYLFSDFQKSTTGEKVIGKNKNFHFYPVQLKAETTNNMFVDSVWFTSVIRKEFGQNEINIRIYNGTDSDQTNIEVSINIDQTRKTIFLDIPKKSAKTTSFTYTNKSKGLKTGEIAIGDRQVTFDDVYHISYNVDNHANILVINNEDATANIRGIFELDDYYHLSSKNASAIMKDDFKDKDLVVINSLNEITSGLAAQLVDFYKSGGTLGLFPGKNANIPQWNLLLSELRMKNIGRKISSGTEIKNINYKDPFFTGVFEKETKNISLPSIGTAYSAIQNNDLDNSIISLSNGLPLATIRTESSSVLMFYSSLDPAFGNFTKDALFPTLLLRLGEISKRQQPLAMTIGSKTNYPIYANFEENQTIHVKNENFDFIPKIDFKLGVNYLTINNLTDYDALKSDSYSIISDKEIGKISLNYDRSESFLNVLTESEITDLLGKQEGNFMKFNEISSVKNSAAIDFDRPLGYWKVFLILAFLFLAIEMIVIRYIK